METLEQVGIWFDQHTAAWLPVDPEAFCQACIELEVWDNCTESVPFEDLAEYFDDDLTAAAMRFTDVAVALNDGTLAEFQFDTDDDQTMMHHEIFLAAATAPYDDAGEMLDRPAWRRAIAALLRENEA